MTAIFIFWTTYAVLPVLFWQIARRLGRRSVVAAGDFNATLCGRCGYDVRELPTNVCPECGSDLNVVGRRTSAQVTRQRWFRRLVPIVFTFLVLFAGFLFAMAALFSFSPRRQVGRMVSPRNAFIGNVVARWPFTITSETRWDRDESPHVFENWFPEHQRIDRISSTIYRQLTRNRQTSVRSPIRL